MAPPQRPRRTGSPLGFRGTVGEVWLSVRARAVSSPEVAFLPMMLHGPSFRAALLLGETGRMKRVNSKNGRSLPHKEPRRKTEPVDHPGSFLPVFLF